MGKSEIAHFELFHLFPQYFPEAFFFNVYLYIPTKGLNSFTTEKINPSFSLAKSRLPLQDEETIQL